MKSLAVILTVAIICYAQAELTAQQIEKIKRFQKECIAESGVNPDLVTQARQGTFVEDEKFKNYLFCFAKRTGFQNEAGDIQMDFLREKVGAALGDQALTEQLISTCAKTKTNPAETTFQATKCFYEKNPKHTNII